jgi:polynucleotide 5'-kinase involved in rRNA processing
LEEAFPAVVRNAQRKAHWLKLMESCEEHVIDLDRISIEGARLGSGMPIHHDDLAQFFRGRVVHGETSGGALFLVAKEEPDDDQMARALDHFHCSRAHIANPSEYEGLLCSFAKADGEDFGMGAIIKIDFEARKVYAHSTAVPPAPIRVLRIGSVRVDTAGRELGETRPWQV